MKTAIKTNLNENVQLMYVLISNGRFLEILTWRERIPNIADVRKLLFLFFYKKYLVLYDVNGNKTFYSAQFQQRSTLLSAYFTIPLALSRLRVIRLSTNQKILLNPCCPEICTHTYFTFQNVQSIQFSPFFGSGFLRI